VLQPFSCSAAMQQLAVAHNVASAERSYTACESASIQRIVKHIANRIQFYLIHAQSAGSC
jgi:hypothetical protein